MSFIADTHVHIYPFYDLAVALRAAATQLGRLAPGLPRVLCLTERRECHFFRDTKAPPRPGREFTFAPAGDRAVVATSSTDGAKLFIVAGRQIATSERLEVHALGCDGEFPDGRSLDETIGSIRDAGGVAVIPWGVGKWMGARGKLVLETLAKNGDVLGGDSSLRPYVWPERFFAATGSRARVIAGSDPLPATGEEKNLGRYATVIDAGFDEQDPAASLLAALLAALRAPAKFRVVGNRNGLAELWRRQQAMKKVAR